MKKYSTFWARFVAGLIDGLVLLPVNLIGLYVIDSPDDGVALFLVWSAIGYSAYWLYSVLLHARYGQTLGKRVMGVKVLDVSEVRIPTLSQAFLRDAVYIAANSIALVYLFNLVLHGEYTHESMEQSTPARIVNWVGMGWFLLEFITMLTNDKRRALHDFIAKTVVVRVTRS